MSSSASTPEPLDSSFQLKLPSFEGPLDLLLHLCQKHELDILDLPVAFVTERYVDYIRLMERLDLDVASEYLVMAATLTHIKSKMLLPPDPTADQDDADPEEELDPRQELIRRLLEYQKYKAAGEELGARGVQGRDVFLRGMEAPEATGPAPLAGIGLFKLLDAFQVVLKRAKQDLAFQITAEGVSIQDRMTQLADRLRTRRRCTFDELFDDVKTVYDVVVTFLAILEMAKRRLARVYQSDPIAPIHLEYRVLDADDDGSAGAGAYGEEVPEPIAAAAAEAEAEAEAAPIPLDEDAPDPTRDSEPGVALESELAPEGDEALETELAPEVDLGTEVEPAAELEMDPGDEPAPDPLDLGDRVAHDPPPSEPDDETPS
jgi:segregation and condensation protein A